MTRKFGTDVVEIQDALTLGDVPITHEQLVTSGDLERAGLRKHDFKLCPLCGGGVLTGHERRKDNDYVSARVWCMKCGCSLKTVVKNIDEIEKADETIRKRWNLRSSS